MIKKGSILEIKWVVTFGYNGWFEEKEIDGKTKQALELLVGYFVKETKDFVIICMGLDKNPDFALFNHPCWIPKGFIKSIKLLKAEEKNK